MKRGQRIGGSVIGLRYLTVLSPSRWAIIVPAREVRQAVARHRLKRRLQVLVRELSPQLPDSYQAVILAGSKANQLPFLELRTQLDRLFKQIH